MSPVDFSQLRSWILSQLPEPLRPPVRRGYRDLCDLARALRARRRLVQGRRIVWLRPEVADLESFRLLYPGAGEVLVRARASLISPGTERAFLLSLPNTNARFPTVPGYSVAGTVEACGRGVSGLKPGQRVAGVAPHASRSLVPPERLVPIPDGVSDEDACFVELGVIALQAIRRARIRPGERVVVLGAGLVGQLILQLARWVGAAPLVAAARSATMQDFARRSGADCFVVVDAAAPEPLDADVVLEATGSPDAVGTALGCATRGGRVVLAGSTRGLTSGVDFEAQMSRREIEVVGAHITSVAERETSPGRWTRGDEARLFLDLVAAGHVQPQGLVTQRASPVDANRVYAELVDGTPGTVGILFDWKTLDPETAKPTAPKPKTSKSTALKPGVAKPMASRTKTPSSRHKFRIGMIGCGEISAFNAAGIRASKSCELLAVMDLEEVTARKLGSEFRVPYTTDLETLIGNPDIDAVLVAIPHHLHAPVTLQAAAAGKHVIVEKPLATTLEDADAMIDACRRAGVILSVLFSFRYEPHVQFARELVQAGALGRVVGTSISFATEKPAGYWGHGYTGRALTDWRGSRERCGGGVLIMNVCHTLDYFRFITGLEVESVYSEFATLNSPVEVEDIIALTLRYDGGAIGSVHAATLARGEQRSEERIWGTHGSLVLAPAPGQVYSLRRVGGVQPGRWQNLGKRTAVNRVAEYLDRLAADIAAGRPPEVPGEDGRVNLAVVLAAYEAGRRGRAASPAVHGSLSSKAQIR